MAGAGADTYRRREPKTPARASRRRRRRGFNGQVRDNTIYYYDYYYNIIGQIRIDNFRSPQRRKTMTMGVLGRARDTVSIKLTAVPRFPREICITRAHHDVPRDGYVHRVPTLPSRHRPKRAYVILRYGVINDRRAF